jgi:hypothetical protein
MEKATTVAATMARDSHGWKENMEHVDKKDNTCSIIFD